MSKLMDIERLIAEQASSPADQRALEQIARRLESTLATEVPYRPEFMAQLRQRLLKAAQRQMTPWYRRPSVVGPGMAVAAVLVLAFGLNLVKQEPAQPPPVQEVPSGTAYEPPSVEPEGTATLVSLPADLREVALPDEPLDPSLHLPVGEDAAGARRLELKRLTARPDEEEFRRLAARLSFHGETQRSAAGWSAEDSGRFLSLTTDGRVTYRNQDAPVGVPDGELARQAARRFLDQAYLPIPAAQPVVVKGDRATTVLYVEQLDGRPVANALTRVEVGQGGTILKADAFIASGVVSGGSYDALSRDEALAAAAARGGAFHQADLVWVRTPGDGVVYLQPYWRLYGIDARGEEIVRYVAALRR